MADESRQQRPATAHSWHVPAGFRPLEPSGNQRFWMNFQKVLGIFSVLMLSSWPAMAADGIEAASGGMDPAMKEQVSNST
jgi:hypothetical protein